MTEIYENMLETCLRSLNEWNSLIKKHLDGAKREEEMKKLRNITEDYCEINSNFERSKAAIEGVQEKLNDPNDKFDNDIEECYEELFNQLESAPTNLRNNRVWCQVFPEEDQDAVIEVEKKKRTIDNKHYQDVSSSDNSLLCAEIFTPPLDPITKAPIKSPYKNKVCNHVYDSTTIYNHIEKSRKRKAHCPYIGCNNKNIKKSDLVKDEALEEKIVIYLSQHADEQSDDD